MTAPLVSAAWLADNLAEVRPADVRWSLTDAAAGRSAHREGHIPGAVFVDLDTDLAAPEGPGRHPLPDAFAFGLRMGELGLGDYRLVVAYDDSGGTVAARLWWMLRSLGHEVAVLDGGWRAWMDAALPVEAGEVAPEPVEFTVHGGWERTVDREGLAAQLGEVVLVDGRAPERYRGEVEPVDPAAGHIPTAINLPVTANLDHSGRMLGADELAGRLRAAGFGGGKDVVVSCGSGVNACHHVLAAVVAGVPEPLLYPGSWSDWSTAGGPVATGDAPGDA